jgi:hypothetical protein
VAVAAVLLAAGCGDDELPTAGSEVPSTVPTTVAADPVAVVLAAAAGYWLSGFEEFTTLHVVERLGQADDEVGHVEYSDDAPQMTAPQRGAIEAALAPRHVMWTHDLESVAGPPMTGSPLPPDQAVVMFAKPTIEGGHAEIVLNLWCGMACGAGTGLVLERSSADEWTVTDRFGGFVA